MLNDENSPTEMKCVDHPWSEINTELQVKALLLNAQQIQFGNILSDQQEYRV